jgi:hypothetical protein
MICEPAYHFTLDDSSVYLSIKEVNGESNIGSGHIANSSKYCSSEVKKNGIQL